MDIKTLAPKAVWNNFAALNAIPRPSKKEEKVIGFIKKFGKSLGLETIDDDIGNVVIRKPATSGREDRKMVTLQSHLDMVCQKNKETDFNFDEEGIQMFIDGDWVTADGTTLGADNGIGVAAIMSILESKDIDHPPIEALFTVDEEDGMTGALKLKPGILKGDILLNLDTEEDDEIDIGCAGGVNVTATKKYATKPIDKKGIILSIKGLQGGHSGMEIHKGLGNANVILGRLLAVGIGHAIQAIRIDAGGLRNAIPREGNVELVVDNTADYIEKAEALKADILEELKHLEENITIEITSARVSGEALSVKDTERFIKALTAAHNGVYRMSPDIAGLVEASNNIARIELHDGKMEVGCFARSSVESTKAQVANQLKAAFELGGLKVIFSDDHPGWQPNRASEIVAVLEKIYMENFHESPKVLACHAGLECGIIGANYPNMDMVSFGPTIKGAHSPDERVSISSVQKFWHFLQEILKKIPVK